jgi:hypothetical protein
VPDYWARAGRANASFAADLSLPLKRSAFWTIRSVDFSQVSTDIGALALKPGLDLVERPAMHPSIRDRGVYRAPGLNVDEGIAPVIDRPGIARPTFL